MKYPLRPLVFWPTFLILLAAVIASYVDLNAFLAISKQLNNLILKNFSWLFSAGSFAMVVLTAIVYFSALGKVRIGGEDAQPLLSKWRWFMVALCTTLAVGVLFWTTAEPLYHLYGPPTSLPIEAGSSAAKSFAMSTMFLHWTITPTPFTWCPRWCLRWCSITVAATSPLAPCSSRCWAQRGSSATPG